MCLGRSQGIALIGRNFESRAGNVGRSQRSAGITKQVKTMGSIGVAKEAKTVIYLPVKGQLLSAFTDRSTGCIYGCEKADGFVKITEVKPSHRTNIAASICENCKTVILKY